MGSALLRGDGTRNTGLVVNHFPFIIL